MDILTLNEYLNRIVYGLPMKLVFLLVGAYLVVFRIRWFSAPLRMMRVSFSETLGAIRERTYGFGGQITPFQATMVALSATVGTGHLLGMLAAVLVGGPGAVFWMWLGYFFGTGSKFAEATLAVHYRRRYADGSVAGGPMYYLSRGLPRFRFLGALFALFAAVAAFGIGNLAQAGAVGGALAPLGLPPALVGLGLALLVGVVLGGGIARVARFAQVVVPLKLLFFLAAFLPLLVLYAGRIPGALALVFQAAFTPEAALGGAAGYSLLAALNAGLGRGIFANEAGLGSAAIAHAQAQVDHPVRQGFWGVTEMFVSFLVTSLTALTFLASGLWQRGGSASEAASALFSAHPLGGLILALTVAVFALGTMVSWGFYGEEAAAYLFGEGIRWPYRLAFAVLAFVGPLGGLEAFLAVSDTLNGLMAIPNLIGLVLLGGVVARLVQGFFRGEPWIPPRD
ncbi:amino acid carrier protein [Thermus oshimai]|jgi:AGCS family alanine or glycine:cation symporter|uniref:Amino acid carrier protein n=1 Tax=Thermus oshimai JL-2 TaxID=751945 RepID=K7QV99_THEOS|nr:amino acid carrier protein [Thermus oshimai]AFV75158.1 amino acid carrier protein [Thermus oshimai JL-2]